MIKIIAIKKLGSSEVPRVACQAAYGASCHPVTDMGWYGMLEVSQKSSPKIPERIVEIGMEIQSVSNGQLVRFSVPCACSRVFFHIDYDGRYIEYNGNPGTWIATYDAPVVTEIGATMIHVPYL